MLTFVAYMKARDLTDTFFFCIGPNSRGAGGLLLDVRRAPGWLRYYLFEALLLQDWTSPDTSKLGLIGSLFSSQTYAISVSRTHSASITPSSTVSGVLPD